MWLMNLIERVDKMIDDVFEIVWCEHEWVFIRKVREQNLRSGFAHDSHVFECLNCQRQKTVELPQDHE